jgi:ParB family chromosome partitioning protein
MTLETRRATGGLGRGLAALIPTAPPSISGAREVAIAAVRPHPDQPRKSFDPVELQQLADSITAHGILQPVIAVETTEGFTLVAGERRLRAAKLAGLTTIPAIVRTANEQEQLELTLVENLQRSDLNAIEEARGYRNLIEAFGLTQERVAERMGRSRPTVANALRILDTAPAVQQAVVDGRISGGHARALASLESHGSQEALLATVVARSLSVRQTEDLTALAREGVRPARRSQATADPDVQQMEAQLRDALGTKVTIATSGKGGRITITWYDDDDLGRLVERLSAHPSMTGDGR